MNMEVADWMPAALDLSLELPSVLSADGGLTGGGGPPSAAPPPPSAPAALGTTSSGGSSSSLDNLEHFNSDAWSSLAATGLAPPLFSPVTPQLGDAPPPSLSAAHAKRCWPAGGGWAEPTSAADLLSPGLADAVLSAAAVPGVAPDVLLRVDPDLLNATDRRQRRRRLRSLKNPRGRVGGVWAPAHGGVTKSLASSPLPASAGWTPSSAAPGGGGAAGGRPPSPRGVALPSAGPGTGGDGSPTTAAAAAAAAADAAVDKKAARVIRNREVALKARQAAKDKAARLAADNAALTARVAELLAENAALSAAAASLRAQVAGGEGEAPAAGGSAQRNWA